MVSTRAPAAAVIGVTHERTGAPLRCTVQAPHCAMPQPNLVPVRPRVSRSTQRTGVVGSASTVVDWPLRMNVVLMPGFPIEWTDGLLPRRRSAEAAADVRCTAFRESAWCGVPFRAGALLWQFGAYADPASSARTALRSRPAVRRRARSVPSSPTTANGPRCAAASQVGGDERRRQRHQPREVHPQQEDGEHREGAVHGLVGRDLEQVGRRSRACPTRARRWRSSRPRSRRAAAPWCSGRSKNRHVRPSQLSATGPRSSTELGRRRQRLRSNPSTRPAHTRWPTGSRRGPAVPRRGSAGTGPRA